jgi:hypothetical protein
MDDDKLLDALNKWQETTQYAKRIKKLDNNIRNVISRLNEWCLQNPNFKRIFRNEPDIEPIWANMSHQNQPLPEDLFRDLFSSNLISAWDIIHGQKLSEDFLLNGGLVERIYSWFDPNANEIMRALCSNHDLSIDFIVKYNRQVCFDCIKKRRMKKN